MFNALKIKIQALNASGFNIAFNSIFLNRYLPINLFKKIFAPRILTLKVEKLNLRVTALTAVSDFGHISAFQKINRRH